MEDKARGSGWRNPWSEERTELVFLAGKKERGFEATSPSLNGDALGQGPFSSHEKRCYKA